jgi:hypothetical protein
MRAALALAVALVAGCGTTLPHDLSVFVALAESKVITGGTVQAVVINDSDHTIGHGVLPCTARVVDAATGERVSPPEACIQPLLLLRPGTTFAFTFTAPERPGTYRLEFNASDEDRDPPVAGLPLVVRSPAFDVSAP